MKDRIPEEFYRGDRHPTVQNVGELIEQLQRLPAELPVHSEWSEGTMLVVYNGNFDDCHLSLVEIEE